MKHRWLEHPYIDKSNLYIDLSYDAPLKQYPEAQRCSDALYPACPKVREVDIC